MKKIRKFMYGLNFVVISFYCFYSILLQWWELLLFSNDGLYFKVIFFSLNAESKSM